MLHKSLKCVIFQALAGLLVIIIMCLETEPGNKSYLPVEQNINFIFRLTSFML